MLYLKVARPTKGRRTHACRLERPLRTKLSLVVVLVTLSSAATLLARSTPEMSCQRAVNWGTPVASGSDGAVLARAEAAPKGHKARALDYDLSAHQTLSRVILLIRENYVEPDRIKPYEMFLAALDYIQRTQPEVMVDDTQAPTRITISAGGQSQAFDLGALDQLWEVTMALRDIFRFLQAHVHEADAQRNIEYAAINGMLSTLDPHSILLRPESFDEVKLSTKGEFGGLGIVISLRDGALTIISPIEGTPASQVGLRAKDKIVKIGEESTVNMGLDEAVQRLRGRPDTPVTISVQRKGWSESRPFTLVRAIIKIQSVTAHLLDDGVGYVKVKSFQGNTFDDLQTHLAQLRRANKDKDLSGLVLDLRNNPGGLLDQAILVSDRFIERGPLVITVGEGNRRREVKNAHVGLDESTYPIVVLLNGGSASASEIVAGALKNHDRALVLGQQSFGKGSVQVLYDFADKSALKLTIAQYLTPGDVSIQSVGIVPDVTVTPAVIEKQAIHLFVDDEAPREKDLEKHLEQHGVTKVTANSIRLYHLDEKERDELTGDATAALEAHDEALASGEHFTYDFETQLAHDIVRRSKTISRPKMIEQATELLEARARDEDGVIAKRMGELGVDWSQAAPQKGTAGAKVALRVTAQDGNGRATGHPDFVAGDTLVLCGEVHNDGAVTLHRVYGTTLSDNPLLKNLEFAFGKLAPGERRQWQVKVKLPADMAPRADEVTLKLGDVHQQVAGRAGSTYVTIAERPRPNFAFRYVLDDATGNGDGLLQAGEAVSLRVAITNLGPGVADDVSLAVKNLAGQSIFLDAGRDKVGALAVGETKLATVRFRVHGPDGAPAPVFAAEAATVQAAPAGAAVPAPAPKPEPQAAADEQATDAEGEPKVYVAPKPGDQLGLRLSIWDATLGAPVTETLQLQVAAPARGVAVPADGQWLRTKHEGTQLWSGAAESAAPYGQLGAGAVVQASQVFGRFTRVKLGGEGAVAFVHNEDVERVPRSKKPPVPKAEVKIARGLAAPHLEIAATPLLVDGDQFVLRGRASSPRGLKDMFVFVGEKKVFFRFLSDLRRDNGVYGFAFEVPVKLQPGTNAVAVFVREDDDLLTRRLFFVHRRKPHAATAVP